MVETRQNNTPRVLVAIGLIGLGILFMLGIDALWPMFIIVPGLLLLALTMIRGPVGAAFAIPGMLITGTGVLLFIQNLTHYWESWSYAWTLYGVFLGLGFIVMGRLIDDDGLQAVGRAFILAGMVSFVCFAFLMELVFDVGGGLGKIWWSLLLIGVGIFLIIKNMVRAPERRLAKSRRKLKQDAPIFTGPVVYGSRKRSASPGSSRLSTSDEVSNDQ
ncbi:MAG: hypothetical protein JXJ20_09535 [Anaerolineae bacterium]|nr:hypothetical protein [Anaerolineae bacterium]